jgi:peptidoglycan hydrolase CwlO-like protein
MSRVYLFAIAMMCLITVAHTAPPVEKEPDAKSPTISELTKENVELKKQLTTLSTQANGLLRKYADLSAKCALQEIEIERLTELTKPSTAKP